MQPSCEVCHSPLRAEDLRLDQAVAKCHACNAVYDLSGRKARDHQVLYLEQALERRLGIEDAPVDGEAATRFVAR